MLQRSIGFKTVKGEGQVPAYAEYLAGELKAHGFAAEYITITPIGETASLTAVYRGTDAKLKPTHVASHMDVVPAKREDWERDPFVPVVENGFLFGRGSGDNKFGFVTSMNAIFWLRKEGFRPRRDIIIVLTGDEETTGETAAGLAQQLKGAELLLNSNAGGARLGDDGRPIVYSMQAAEKTYMDFEVTITNPGGHSSRPGPAKVFIGDSSTWGFLLEPDQTLSAYINQSAVVMPDGRYLRTYNLGYPVMSLAKDLLILNEAMAYQPDLIVWPVTLESFPGDKQLTHPLLQQNPERVSLLNEKYSLGLDTQAPGLEKDSIWDETIFGA